MSFFLGSGLVEDERGAGTVEVFLTVGVEDFVPFVWAVFLSDTGDTTSMSWSSSLFLFLDFGLGSAEDEAVEDEEAGARAGGAADEEEVVGPDVTVVVVGVVTTSPFLAAL
jgi:hypothetical protein